MVRVMAYDRKKIFEQAKEAITKHKLIFMDDIVSFLPCRKSTFYEHSCFHIFVKKLAQW